MDYPSDASKMNNKMVSSWLPRKRGNDDISLMHII